MAMFLLCEGFDGNMPSKNMSLCHGHYFDLKVTVNQYLPKTRTYMNFSLILLRRTILPSETKTSIEVSLYKQAS
jgi:hypothetical protein